MTAIGSCNGMAPVRRQAITRANVDVLSTNISEIWIKTKPIFSSPSVLNCGDAWNLSLKTGVVKIQDDNLAVTGSRRGNIMTILLINGKACHRMGDNFIAILNNYTKL